MARLRLGDIGKVSMCKRVLKHETLPEGDIPFYKISTFGGRADVFIARELYDNYRLKYSYPKCGDILISAAGTVGKTVVYNGSPAYFQDSNIVWIANNEKVVLNRYLYYFYKTEPWRTTNGSTISRIYNENLRDIEIDVPSLNTQSKIASVLEKLDEKIDINNKINAELEATARDLYNYWFVQFEFPDDNQRPYKTAGGAMVYNEELKRKIPATWSAGGLNRFIANEKTGDWGKESAQANYSRKVTCIRGTDLNSILQTQQINAPERFILEKNTHKLLQKNDIVIEISGGSPTQSTGRAAYITDKVMSMFDNPLICSNFCKAISVKKDLHLFFVYYLWQQLYDNGVFFGYEGKTSGIKNLLYENFISSYEVVLPDEEILTKFNDAIGPLSSAIVANRKEAMRLLSVRDWLLPMLMNGQLKVVD